MTYRTPAPRYSRPIPTTEFVPVTLLDRMIDASRAAAVREKADRMFRIGVALGVLASLAIVAVLASLPPL